MKLETRRRRNISCRSSWEEAAVAAGVLVCFLKLNVTLVVVQVTELLIYI